METSFPLVTLQPVLNTRNAWAALLLEAAPGCEGATLARIFGELGLGEALGSLSCIVAQPDLGADLDGLPAEKIVLQLPLAYCCDRASDEAIDASQRKGFRVMMDGVPAEEQVPAAAVSALALPCTGWQLPPGTSAWLSRLPGPHMAFAPDGLNCPGRCHFQWLARHLGQPPALGPKGNDAPSRSLLLELLSQVANDADSHAIEATIRRDPQLSYHLLRLVNSVAFSLTAKIGSFSQAITLLGRRQLQRWLQLLLYTRAQDGDSANALLPRAAMRAGLAEALCAVRGGSRDEQDRAFMVGMFSLLDLIFGQPVAEIVRPLNLVDDVQDALARHAGRFGGILRLVEAVDTLSAAELGPVLAEVGIGREDWLRSLIRAYGWAIQVSREA